MNEIIVGMADLKIAQGDLVLKTSLGSCIAVCLYEREQKVGGMIHFMLPHIPASGDKNKIAKYGDVGIMQLIKTMLSEHRLKKENLRAKIFGGAKMLKCSKEDIGYKNEQLAREILKNEKIKIIASKVGGTKGYKIEFNLQNGMVFCQILGEECTEH